MTSPHFHLFNTPTAIPHTSRIGDDCQPQRAQTSLEQTTKTDIFRHGMSVDGAAGTFHSPHLITPRALHKMRMYIHYYFRASVKSRDIGKPMLLQNIKVGCGSNKKRKNVLSRTVVSPALSSAQAGLLKGVGGVEVPGSKPGPYPPSISWVRRPLRRGPETLCRTTPAIERIARPLRRQCPRS